MERHMTAIRCQLTCTWLLGLSIQELMFVPLNAHYDAPAKHKYPCKGTKALGYACCSNLSMKV